uniref:Coiled-coil domain containing 178 n=1 Tax=Sus scrofa TaxID=9823 RepID=A0A287A194_PIG
MPENKIISYCPTGRDQTKKGNATSQALVQFNAPKEAVEVFHENKMTNTEGVNKGIYFSYPCRRKSCALVNIPALCVNKMISHIEDVESKIQENLKKFETSLEEWSRTSSIKDLKEDGRVATPVKEVKPEELRDEKYPELKQEMETLLSEAIYLIKSLETDRAEAEEALKQQKSRKKKINMKIDSWSIWKLQEIPLAVQNEHEAFLRDIIELRWHLEDKTRRLKHFEEQKRKLEEANAKLQADIDYMNKHRPLLLAKRDQDLEALREYYQKKFEVMELYKQIHGELEEAIENLKKAKLNAKQNREHMEKDIRDDEISIEAYLDDLKRVHDQLVWKGKIYESEYMEALNNFYATKRAWDIKLSNIAKDFSDVSIAYSRLMEENKRLGIDIENVLDYINNSIRKKSEFESEIQTLLKLRSKNEDFLRQLYKEAYNIGAVFHLTRFKTEGIEQKIAEVRRKFKGREEFLKKLTRGEVANGMIIQKRLFSLQEEFSLEKLNLSRTKAIHALALGQIEIPLLQLEEEAIKIRTIHKEHGDTLDDIIGRKEHVKKNVEKTKKKLRKKEKKTQNALIETEEKRSMIFKELETTKSKTIIYHAKINQLNKDLEEKQKEKIVFDRTLDRLKNQFITLREKKEHAQAVFDHLISEKKACEERIYEEEQRFKTFFTMRQKTLANIKKVQDDSLEENLQLAQEYQQLQTIFLTVKDNYFSLFERQLSLDDSIRDMKQFCQLQRRIHKVWQKHFELVVLYSQMRLAKFQIDSQESIQKILTVQNQYDLKKE